MQLINPASESSGPAIEEQGGVLMPCVTRPDGTETTWMAVITDNKLFNVSLNRTEAAQDAKARAMETSTDPTQIGVSVDIILDSVMVDGEEIGLLKGYDGSVIDPSSDRPRNVYVVNKMRNSGDLVLTNGNSTGRNSSGLGFGSHGSQLINNVVKDLQKPDFRRRMTMYLMFLNVLYLGSIEVDYKNFTFEPKGDDELAQKVGVIEYELSKRLKRQRATASAASNDAEEQDAEKQNAEAQETENQNADSEDTSGEEAENREPEEAGAAGDPLSDL